MLLCTVYLHSLALRRVQGLAQYTSTVFHGSDALVSPCLLLMALYSLCTLSVRDLQAAQGAAGLPRACSELQQTLCPCLMTMLAQTWYSH